jgi:hypothetical protein
LKKLASPFHLYVAAIMAVGGACFGWVLTHQTQEVMVGAPPLLFVLLGCTIVAELLPINVVLRGQEGELLTSTAFAFATMIAFGPGAAVPALCLASIIGRRIQWQPFWPRQ